MFDVPDICPVDVPFNHKINNAAIVVLGLLHGKINFEKSITLSVMCGWDTDCNGATACLILGVISGANKLLKKWKDPIYNLYLYAIFGDTPISDLAKRTFNLKII